MPKNDEIFIIDKDDKKQKGKILFTFEINGDEFIFYQIKDLVFASKIDDNKKLLPIANDEWKFVEKIFKEFMKEHEEDYEINI